MAFLWASSDGRAFRSQPRQHWVGRKSLPPGDSVHTQCTHMIVTQHPASRRAWKAVRPCAASHSASLQQRPPRARARARARARRAGARAFCCSCTMSSRQSLRNSRFFSTSGATPRSRRSWSPALVAASGSSATISAAPSVLRAAPPPWLRLPCSARSPRRPGPLLRALLCRLCFVQASCADGVQHAGEQRPVPPEGGSGVGTCCRRRWGSRQTRRARTRRPPSASRSSPPRSCTPAGAAASAPSGSHLGRALAAGSPSVQSPCKRS